MQFNEQVKNYLSSMKDDEMSEQLSELYALTQVNCSVVMKGKGKFELKYSADNAAYARRIYKIIKNSFSIIPIISVIETTSFGDKQSYNVTVTNNDDCKEILYNLNMISYDGIPLFSYNIDTDFINSESQKKAYLRAVFSTCGYIHSPTKNICVEFHIKNELFAQNFVAFLSTFEINAKLRIKKSGIIVYTKKANEISTLLALFSDYVHMLEFENKIAMKEMRNKLQRTVNCETSNMNKMVNASLIQVNAINKIINTIGLNSLPEHLIATAQLRLDYPDSSLNELAELDVKGISKSTLNKRLQKIISIADGIK